MATKEQELNAAIFAELTALIAKYKPQIKSLEDTGGRFALEKSFLDLSDNILYYLKANGPK